MFIPWLIYSIMIMPWLIYSKWLPNLWIWKDFLKFLFVFTAFGKYLFLLFGLDLWAGGGANRCINIWLISDLAGISFIKIGKFGHHHHQQILTLADNKPKCQTWREPWRSFLQKPVCLFKFLSWKRANGNFIIFLKRKICFKFNPTSSWTFQQI